jgi:hypothetical protein
LLDYPAQRGVLYEYYIKEYQGNGIGKEMIRRTQEELEDTVALILLSAPEAMSYYPYCGFEKADNAWVIKRKKEKKILLNQFSYIHYSMTLPPSYINFSRFFDTRTTNLCRTSRPK